MGQVQGQSVGIGEIRIWSRDRVWGRGKLKMWLVTYLKRRWGYSEESSFEQEE